MMSTKGFFITVAAAGLMFSLAASLAFSDPGPQHKKRLPRPVKLGSSGGNVNDKTTQFCCSGTLGALVKDAQGKKFILSNNHVIAKSNTAKIGDAISQPGHIDAGCAVKSTDVVANLSRFVRIKYGPNTNNRVDGAIAAIIPGMVNPNGFIVDAKVPGVPVAPLVGMKVKKSGRTTGLRRGIIQALNLTVSVRYPTKCGSTTTKIARFVDQIGVSDAPAGTAPPFIAGGDSGSLLVQDRATCPGTVGLLFAGDSIGNGVANRIQTVLTQLGNLQMVSCVPPPAAAAEEQSVGGLSMLSADFQNAAAVQARHEDALLRIPGVVGVGIGLASDDGAKPAIVVYTVRGTRVAEVSDALPAMLEHLPVRRIVTGEFVAF